MRKEVVLEYSYRLAGGDVAIIEMNRRQALAFSFQRAAAWVAGGRYLHTQNDMGGYMTATLPYEEFQSLLTDKRILPPCVLRAFEAADAQSRLCDSSEYYETAHDIEIVPGARVTVKCHVPAHGQDGP